MPLLVLTLAGAVWPGPWADRRIAATALASAGLAGAAHLTSAAVHGLEEPRYILSVAVFTLHATFAGALFALVRATGWLRRRGPGAYSAR